MFAFYFTLYPLPGIIDDGIYKNFKVTRVYIKNTLRDDTIPIRRYKNALMILTKSFLKMAFLKCLFSVDNIFAFVVDTDSNHS